MSDSIARPNYFEGQILGAEDLSAGLDYGRFAQARHNRYAHTPGIAEGLALQAGPPKRTVRGTDYVEVTVTPGVAVDGSGREILITAAQRLDEGQIPGVSVGDSASFPDKKGPWYPVFLLGFDGAALPDAGACGAAGGAARIPEQAEIRLGRPGDEADLESRGSVEDVTAGPEGGAAWRLLLGFVRFTSMDERGEPRALFAEVSDRSPDSLASRRHVGVRAEEVTSPSGRLSLRSRPGAQAGKPAVILDESQGGQLVFGLQDGQGGINRVFWVDAKGDVNATGKLAGLTAGIFVESGVATDGMVLPLPAGVTPEQIQSGKVLLQIHVTPRAPGGVPPFDDESGPPTLWGALPLECSVDEERRVRCVFRWFLIDSQGATPPKSKFYDHAGACDYTILAVVPPAKESGQ